MKNTTKFLGIVILAAASFAMLACPTDGGSYDDGRFNLATLKAPDVRSVYLSDIPVKGGKRAAAGGDTISSLSYISDTGQNAPVLFSTPSGKKQFVFEVTSLEQLGERCMIIGITGYYEVTGTGAAGSYTVGPFVSTTTYDGYWDDGTFVEYPQIHSVLIDMKNSKLYDFSEFKPRWNSEGPVRFMEGNIIYTIKSDNNDGTVYKIDLSTASAGSALQAVPLNHSSFMSINSITLPYTINNKLIGNKSWGFNWYDNISLDVSGTKPPQEFKYPADTGVSYNHKDYFFRTNVLIRDLTDKLWAFIKHNNSYRNYSIAEVGIDDSGQCTLSELIDDQLSFDTSNSYSTDNPIYTFNAARTGSALFQNYGNYSYAAGEMKSYLNNGVVTLYPKGFVRLHQEVDGIRVESVELATLPTGSIVRKSVISSEDYLFYLEGKSIKRLKLATGSSPQVVYSHSGIMDIVDTRDLLTASGRKLIFYQYATSTEVHTYSLDMYNPTAQPELLAASDAEVRSIVELDF